MKEVMLYNGVSVPALGYGSYRLPKKQTAEWIAEALEAGYRHIDTAQIYYNEEEVGEGILSSGIARKEIFLTTKIWTYNYGDGKTYESFVGSLKKLKTDYVDLLLLHSPYGDYYGAYRDLERIYREGKAKAIGVSNFPANRFVDLVRHVTIKPMVNQIEINPLNLNTETRLWDDKYNARTEAYAPLGEGNKDVLNNPVLLKIAEKHHTGVVNVIFAYLASLDLIVLSTTTKKERMHSNQDIGSFALSEEEISAIARINKEETLMGNTFDGQEAEDFANTGKE